MDFPFYDTAYNSVTVSAMLGCAWHEPGRRPGHRGLKIPTISFPNRCVYAWWDNLAVGPVSATGTSTTVVRLRSDRYAVIVYEDASRVGADTANGITFELIFHENGTVNVQYKDVETGDLTFDNARNATIGLENEDGTDGLCYLYSVPPLDSGVNGLSNRLSAAGPSDSSRSGVTQQRAPSSGRTPTSSRDDYAPGDYPERRDGFRLHSVFMHIGGYSDTSS